MAVTKGGSRLIIHYNRKIGKTRRKALRKFLSKKRRALLKTLKKGYKNLNIRKSLKRRKSLRRSKSLNRRKSLKRSKSLKRRKSLKGGAPLSPANIDFANTNNTEHVVIEDSAVYSTNEGLKGESSALANPPITTRSNGCAK